MKTGFSARLVAGGVLFGATAAMAQTPIETIIPQDTLELPAEREIIVREYVVRQPAQPVIIESGGTVRPGSVIPEHVQLRLFADISVPNLRGLAYFVSPDEKIVIVNPTTRQVVRIISARTTGAIALAPEERTRIRDYVLRERRASVVAPSGFSVAVGAILPDAVQVYSLPADVGVTQYGYTVIGNRTVLVEPASRRIVQVIE